MASNERIRKYLDAGNVLGQVSRGRAEEIVRELVNAGDIQRANAQEWVDALVDRSRRTSEQLIELVRREVQAQMQRIDGTALETVANQVAEALKKSAQAGASVSKGVRTRAEKTATRVTSHAGKATQGVHHRATSTAKGVSAQAGKTAKGVSAQAGKTAKGVQHRASTTAKDVSAQAGKTATRARAVATRVTPTQAAQPAEDSTPHRTTRQHKAAS